MKKKKKNNNLSEENENEETEILNLDFFQIILLIILIYIKFKRCLITPDIKAKSLMFYCNDSRVSFNEYEKLSNYSSYKCEYYINTIKVCFCPINYYKCNKDELKQLFCKINNLTANDN